VDVSVVLCTWNNCGPLAVTLDALCRCIIPANLKWELVLVNNNRTDETQRVAHAFAEKLPLRYVDEPRQGLSRAKNAGLKAASGRLVVFTDDDVRFCPEWLVTYWSAFQERPFGLYFGGPIACEYEDTRLDGELLRVAPLSVTASTGAQRLGR
jgi:glucosyl-dolichyl phosphate glucuronosyltransferase